MTGNEVLVKPLAQDDVIKTFLTSIDDDTQNKIVNYMEYNL